MNFVWAVELVYAGPFGYRVRRAKHRISLFTLAAPAALGIGTIHHISFFFLSIFIFSVFICKPGDL